MNCLLHRPPRLGWDVNEPRRKKNYNGSQAYSKKKSFSIYSKLG